MQARTGRVSVPFMNPAAHTETPIRERADHRGDHAGTRSPQRRRRGRLTSVLLALGSVALLAGCAPASAAPTLTPTPTSLLAGLFSSEDEALNAAREVYLQYAALSEALSADPTMDTAQLQAITSPDLFAAEIEARDALIKYDVVMVGSIVYSQFGFIEARDSTVNISSCADVSGARLINSEGVDITDDSDSSVSAMDIVVSFAGSTGRVDSIDAKEGLECVG